MWKTLKQCNGHKVLLSSIPASCHSLRIELKESDIEVHMSIGEGLESMLPKLRSLALKGDWSLLGSERTSFASMSKHRLEGTKKEFSWCTGIDCCIDGCCCLLQIEIVPFFSDWFSPCTYFSDARVDNRVVKIEHRQFTVKNYGGASPCF